MYSRIHRRIDVMYGHAARNAAHGVLLRNEQIDLFAPLHSVSVETVRDCINSMRSLFLKMVVEDDDDEQDDSRKGVDVVNESEPIDDAKLHVDKIEFLGKFLSGSISQKSIHAATAWLLGGVSIETVAMAYIVSLPELNYAINLFTKTDKKLEKLYGKS